MTSSAAITALTNARDPHQAGGPQACGAAAGDAGEALEHRVFALYSARHTSWRDGLVDRAPLWAEVFAEVKSMTAEASFTSAGTPDAVTMEFKAAKSARGKIGPPELFYFLRSIDVNIPMEHVERIAELISPTEDFRFGEKDLLEYVKMVRQGIDTQQKEQGGKS